MRAEYNEITIMLQVFKRKAIEEDFAYQRHVSLVCYMPLKGALSWNVERDDNSWGLTTDQEKVRELSINIVGAHTVAVLPRNPQKEDEIVSVISGTPVVNDFQETEWSSKHWVADALLRLQEKGIISAAVFERA